MTRLATPLLWLLLVAALVASRAADAQEADGPVSVPAIIAQAAADEGADPDVLACIAWRESHNNPLAVSRTGDYGLMQFHRLLGGWTLMALTPWADKSPFDADASAHAAAFLIARGYGPRWSTWWGCQ